VRRRALTPARATPVHAARAEREAVAFANTLMLLLGTEGIGTQCSAMVTPLFDSIARQWRKQVTAVTTV
jgi:hypothetical protein